jgi:hypothetical protein
MCRRRGRALGSWLVLSRVHWVRPELAVEVKYLSWNNLLRQLIYQELREDKVFTNGHEVETALAGYAALAGTAAHGSGDYD